MALAVRTAPGLVGQDRDDLSVPGAELLRDAALPRRKRDRRERPEIGLAGALKITLVIKRLHGCVGRIAVGEVVSELERADVRLDLLQSDLACRFDTSRRPCFLSVTKVCQAGGREYSKRSWGATRQ